METKNLMMGIDHQTTFDISNLEQMYIDSCRQHEVVPNTNILCGFYKAEVKKSGKELCCLEIFLDNLKDTDIPALIDLCTAIDSSEIEVVDIYNGPSCALSEEYALSLMRAFTKKLHLVDLRDFSFGKDFLRDLSQRGLTCQVLNLRSSHFRKLNMTGEFLHLRILNLDFSTSLTSFQEDCFTCMPNLASISMCETRIANLYTTTAALSKLSSLVELRFQKWIYCNDTGGSSSSSGVKLDDQIVFRTGGIYGGEEHIDLNSSIEDGLLNGFSPSSLTINQGVQSMMEDSSNDSEVDFLTSQQEVDYWELFSHLFPQWNREANPLNQVSLGKLWNQNEKSFAGSFTRHLADVTLRYISCHASPICFEKHYRDYMIASLPKLKALDNLPIRDTDKEKASTTFSRYFEYLPYNRKHKESVISILHNREIKDRHSVFRTKNRYPAYSQYGYMRSLCAAKVGSSAWPFLCPLSVSSCELGDGNRSFRPRQFEYHPSISSLMVFGTLDGEVVAINHENGKILGYVPSLGAMTSVLGLCWLKKHPSKLVAGSDNGSLRLYDIEHMPQTVAGMHSGSASVSFDDFDQLTSVHVNSSDELLLASGYSKNIALYDINYGKRIQVFNDMHREHINVVKFSNHAPSIFATSSFDRNVKLWDLRQKPIHPCFTSSSSRGNVMVCFSPDDHYLLVSAVDNEVRQLLAVDGRVHLNFEISPTGSSQNYTRSYYMNGRDYIISGSCDEHVVCVCCAQTGRRLRDISLEGRGSRSSMYVQSLRGDPFRDFNMSILAAYMRPSSKSEIVKVNMLASYKQAKEYWHNSQPSNRMGG